MATVGFVVGAGFLLAAVGAGAFLVAKSITERATGAYLRREPKREKENA